MNIQNDRVVTLFYRLTEKDGQDLEDNSEGVPLAYLHGHRNLLPALEEALTGLAAGDTTCVVLPPEKAYGVRRENAAQRVPVKHLISAPKKLKPGLVVQVQTEQGAKAVTVIKSGRFMVDVDFNHPFAGKTLQFDIKIDSVREATKEELEHRHAHGVGGHHH